MLRSFIDGCPRELQRGCSSPSGVVMRSPQRSAMGGGHAVTSSWALRGNQAVRHLEATGACDRAVSAWRQLPDDLQRGIGEVCASGPGAFNGGQVDAHGVLFCLLCFEQIPGAGRLWRRSGCDSVGGVPAIGSGDGGIVLFSGERRDPLRWSWRHRRSSPPAPREERGGGRLAKGVRGGGLSQFGDEGEDRRAVRLHRAVNSHV